MGGNKWKEGSVRCLVASLLHHACTARWAAYEAPQIRHLRGSAHQARKSRVLWETQRVREQRQRDHVVHKNDVRVPRERIRAQEDPCEVENNVPRENDCDRVAVYPVQEPHDAQPAQERKEKEIRPASCDGKCRMSLCFPAGQRRRLRFTQEKANVLHLSCSSYCRLGFGTGCEARGAALPGGGCLCCVCAIANPRDYSPQSKLLAGLVEQRPLRKYALANRDCRQQSNVLSSRCLNLVVSAASVNRFLRFRFRTFGGGEEREVPPHLFPGSQVSWTSSGAARRKMVSACV